MTAMPVVNSMAPMSAAQHKAALWADGQQQVYAVVMASRIPGLPGRLAEADVLNHDCLIPGALEPEQQQSAPYLLHLKRDSAFTDWLLFEAPLSLSEWGLLVRSSVGMTTLRNHLRRHLQARLPSGHEISLNWMDRDIFIALISHADAASLGPFFGPVSSFTLAGCQSWRHAALAFNGLQQHEVPLARAA